VGTEMPGTLTEISKTKKVNKINSKLYGPRKIKTMNERKW